ncbi:MAG TPA: hypothetical protein VFI34_06415 [Candidatus Limnocylindrales bacterium]|nr:hypothetical protein [Candidatus Limnocylindrales bacterium]
MTISTFDAIVHRHHPDPTELGRACRACGRPWPCDVRALADAIGRRHDRPAARAARRSTAAEAGVLA